MGEALAQLTRVDAGLAGQISDQRRIIAFRNILVHGYADVDDRLVVVMARSLRIYFGLVTVARSASNCRRLTLYASGTDLER